MQPIFYLLLFILYLFSSLLENINCSQGNKI